jgi:hypothetical protein
MNSFVRPPSRLRWAALPLVLALGGCDIMGILGIETAGQIAEQKEAEGKAIGSGCRHAERSIEECYQNNARASKAAVFAGWREMDEYMRENKIAAMPPKAKPSMIDETADGEPVGKGGTQNARAGNSAAASAVRPTSAGGAIPSIRPVLPAPGAVSTPTRPASGSATTPRPATTPVQRSN